MSKRRDIPVLPLPATDTHCHLDYLEESDVDLTLSAAAKRNVTHCQTIAVSKENLTKVLEIARRHDNVRASQGIHPHEAEGFDDEAAELILENVTDPNVFAVGEIGLDYYYDRADREVQRKVFANQLALAAEVDKPIVVHTREADADTEAILREHLPDMGKRGVIHSFTSSLELAEFCLEAGFHLGFNGIITFNRADNVREVLRATPIDRLLLETDAPYLTPVPYRGKPNGPHYLPFVAERVAQEKGVALDALLEQVASNVDQAFG